jgi:hypothetical protein
MARVASRVRRAIALGNIDFLEECLAGDIAITLDAASCELAAESNQLDMLKWLRSKGVPWNRFLCDVAAQCGHLELLQWAHQNGAIICGWTCLKPAPNCEEYVRKWFTVDDRDPHTES